LFDVEGYCFFHPVKIGIANPSVSELLAHAKAVEALLWGILVSTSVVLVMLLIQKRKLLTLVDEWGDGCKSMLPAMLMLVMAWALSEIVQSMHLGKFVGSLLSRYSVCV
jgi:Na+/H+ antiporter NhaC